MACESIVGPLCGTEQMKWTSFFFLNVVRVIGSVSLLLDSVGPNMPGKLWGDSYWKLLDNSFSPEKKTFPTIIRVISNNSSSWLPL